jgi:phosphoribosylformylglycinamidine synthase subunit PurS
MKNFKAEVKIKLRQGILDVQGKTVEQALHSIEFSMLSNLRLGKFVEMNVEADNEDIAFKYVEDACKKLIANPIIEDFFIEIIDL